MKIALLAFASVSDVLGVRERTVELEQGCSVADLKTQLEGNHAELRPLWEGLAVAVNGQLESDECVLRDGDEVALLPPVSGGVDDSARLVTGPIDVEDVRRRVADPACGAVVLFLGDVRNSHEDRPVDGITYTAYEAMAEERLRTIEDELQRSSEGAKVAIVHRLGRLDVGETSVAIAVSAPHRAAGYAASRSALERLKAEVPIWKKEHYLDGGERWREEEALG